jgi:hypothetical protein
VADVVAFLASPTSQKHLGPSHQARLVREPVHDVIRRELVRIIRQVHRIPAFA